MKVIVASFPRCGTKTLKKCLTILGYTVYDFDENFTYLEKEWVDIMTNGPSVEAFKKMYHDVDAVTDIPSCRYWETILEAFPDAKVILTIRKSEEEWMKSWDKQMNAIDTHIKWRMQALLTPTGRRFFYFQRHMGRVLLDCASQGFFESMIQPDPEIKKRKYREHNEAVLQRVPKDKLLVFKFDDGWKPLCDFLQKDVPDCPLPYIHKGATVNEKDVALNLFKRMDEELFIACALLIVVLTLPLFYLVW